MHLNDLPLLLRKCKTDLLPPTDKNVKMAKHYSPDFLKKNSFLINFHDRITKDDKDEILS